jgi:integrase
MLSEANMATRINFTKEAINTLPAPKSGKRSTYLDSKTVGLQLRTTSNGTVTFSVYRRTKGGGPERITLGRFPDMTIKQARRKAAEINSDIANGLNPSEVKRERKSGLTFSDLFAEYLERHSKPAKKTWAEDKSKYETYLARPLGNKKLSTIDQSSIAAIHGKITKAGHQVTANRVKALVSSIFGWAISVGLWQANPALGIRLNREHSRDRFIQNDELRKFFQALAEEENSTMRDYFLLSLLTGARRANVLSMRWVDINLKRAEWRIEETKNGTPQTITLSPEALTILRNRNPSEPTTFVFPGNGRSGHLIEPKKSWKRILNRAGIDDLRIHDLRRTLASWQARTGASLAIIGKSLNHKNQDTTAIYARLDLEPVRESVNTATAVIMGAARLRGDTRKDHENQLLRRATDFKIADNEQPKSVLEKITALARLGAEPYDGIRGTLPIWMPPLIINEFKKIQTKLQIGDRSTDRCTPDQILQYIEDYPGYLNGNKPEIVSVDIPDRLVDDIDRLWVLKYAAELGEQDKKSGLAILHSKETAADLLYGQKYKKVQPEKARKSSSEVHDKNLAINQIISMLAISSEHENEIAKELWAHFLSELNDRNLHPYQFDIKQDITKWKCEYDFRDNRESITFKQFSNIVSESRNRFRTILHSGLRVTKKNPVSPDN